MRKNLHNDFEKIADIGWRYLKREEKQIFKLYKGNLDLFRQVLGENFQKYGDKEGKLHYSEMARGKRLPNLFAWITNTIGSLYRAISHVLEGIFGSLFIDSYFRTAHLLEIATRARLGYMGIRTEMVKAVVQAPIAKLTLNERLERNRKTLTMKIRESLTMGLVRGSSYKEMADDIKVVLEGDAVKSRRVVRTEGHRVMSEGVQQSVMHAMSKGVIMVKSWLNSKDERVRDEHNHMQDKYGDNPIPADQDFENDLTGGKGPTPGNLGVAKDDVNCRCVAVYEIVGANVPRDDSSVIVKFDDWKKDRGVDDKVA